MSVQVTAALIAAAAAAAFLASEAWRRWRGTRILQAAPAAVARDGAYILYFSGEGCTICRTHQEPALRRLQGVHVEKVDALREAELAQRYGVYTLPTTLVVAPDGRPLRVNYGYAPASKLAAQLREAAQLT
jgi:hypothetical protein